LAFVLAYASPTADIMDTNAVSTSMENTVAVSAVSPQVKNCVDLFVACVPPFVFGILILLLLLKLAFSALKAAVKVVL